MVFYFLYHISRPYLAVLLYADGVGRGSGTMNRLNKIGIAVAAPSCRRRFFARSSCASASVVPHYYSPPSSIFLARKYATNNHVHSDEEPSTSIGEKRGRRVWRSINDTDDEWTNTILNSRINDSPIAFVSSDGSSAVESKFWNMAVDDGNDRRLVDESLSRICEQVMCFPALSLHDIPRFLPNDAHL